MDSPKYNRTMHLPWSPGGTSDDKRAASVESLLNKHILITEKMDGSNTSWEQKGCFARTHANAPSHESFDMMKALHASIKCLIGEEMQVFGEWLYAKHSIHYTALPGYFMIFGIRFLWPESYWRSWDYITECSMEWGLPKVPELWTGMVSSAKELEDITTQLASEPSRCGGEREGVVVRIYDGFDDGDFEKCVMKYVRANHVQTSEHWKNQQIVKNKLKI